MKHHFYTKNKIQNIVNDNISLIDDRISRIYWFDIICLIYLFLDATDKKNLQKQRQLINPEPQNPNPQSSK